MTALSIKLTVLIAALVVTTTCFSEHYGAPISEDKAISLRAAIQQLETQSPAKVLVTAKVGSVCEQKGCWMALTSKDDEMRVTFKDYGFFVPFNIVGKNVTVEGVLEKIQMSLAESKHMVQDGGGDPDSVKQPLSEFRMIASGVRVETGK